jgi:hypothetical protein
MKLDHSLLTTLNENASVPEELRSCLNAHGLYSTLQFVLRLSPRIHRILAATPTSIYDSSQISFEQVQAFSTYLHETVHWWQHIGSTAGLILSLSHPVQSHGNFTHLKIFLREIGPKKSILKFARDNKPGDRISGGGSRATNFVVNTYKDVGFFQLIATRPELIREKGIGDDSLFENVGHSYYVTYANTLRLLIDQFDPDCEFLPDPRTWEPAFEALKKEKEEGFYLGSPIPIPPVGLWQIFEGQARFVQLQYLHFGSGGEFEWDNARSLGMFSPIYVEAFKTFLELTESEWPESIDSPLVGLFLAVCDMTLNAGEGFPLPLVSPHTFITDNDPGTRFTFLCRMIALRAPHLKTAVKHYSRDEYIQVTEVLGNLLRTPTPLKIAQTVSDWSETHDRLITLMEENRMFRFSDVDMPARLLFARYIAFNRDKALRPEVLCWPGAWLAGTRASAEGELIFCRNRALFLDKEEDDGIFPAELPDKDPTIVHETFTKFYGWIVNYDLISQWIIADGPFRYEYEWLSTAHDPAAVKDRTARGFEHVFHVHPDDFEIL